MEEVNWSREYDLEETLLAYEIFGDKKINQLTELELIKILEDYSVRYVKGTRDQLASGLVQLLEVTQLWNQPTNESNINIIRCSTIIKLDVLAKGDDPYNWLDYATHYLATMLLSPLLTKPPTTRSKKKALLNKPQLPSSVNTLPSTPSKDQCRSPIVTIPTSDSSTTKTEQPKIKQIINTLHSTILPLIPESSAKDKFTSILNELEKEATILLFKSRAPDSQPGDEQNNPSLQSILATAQSNQASIKQLNQIVQKLLNTNFNRVKPSYAEALQNNTHSHTSLQSSNQPHYSLTTKHTLLVDRKDDNDHTINIKQSFKTLINPAKLKTGILRIREVTKGRLIVHCADQSSCDSIKKTIQEDSNSKISVKDDNKKHPTVMLKWVDKSLTDDQIVEGLFSQNPHLTQVKNSFKGPWTPPRILFKRNSASTMNVIIRVHPVLYLPIIKSQRICLGYNSVQVQPYTVLTQCFKCLDYGHTTKWCTIQTQSCSQCASEHHKNNCDKSSDLPQQCVNCLNSPRFKQQYSPHSVFSSLCPVRNLILKRIDERTDYGF